MKDLALEVEVDETKKQEVISYMTCGCGKLAYRDSEGKYICSNCKTEVTSTCRGW
ncbi:MAG: hypothetical protein V1770_05675 [bacterium]